MGDEDSLMWVEKYRPLEIVDLISHERIITTITKLVDENKLPHLLLYGRPGVGKTTTILAVARRMYGSKFQSMVLELNASDERGIDVVRDQINSFASSHKLLHHIGDIGDIGSVKDNNYKLVILDEADQLTRPAQFALRRIIEKYSFNVRFCLLANEVNKIIPALQSRCTKFRFGPLKPEQMLTKLKVIAEKEKILGIGTEEGLKTIIRLSAGDMRRAIHISQSCHAAFGIVTEETVYRTTGLPSSSDIKKILHLLMSAPCKVAFDQVLAIQTKNCLSLTNIVSSIHESVLQTNIEPKVLAVLLNKLSDLEYRLAFGVNERLQLGALVGIFHIFQVQEKIGGQSCPTLVIVK